MSTSSHRCWCVRLCLCVICISFIYTPEKKNIVAFALDNFIICRPNCFMSPPPPQYYYLYPYIWVSKFRASSHLRYLSHYTFYIYIYIYISSVSADHSVAGYLLHGRGYYQLCKAKGPNIFFFACYSTTSTLIDDKKGSLKGCKRVEPNQVLA